MNDKKTTLLLDLDETCFIALSDSEFSLYGQTINSIKVSSPYRRVEPTN
jgi:hypothetical protein